MLKGGVKRETFDIWVCKKQPFETMYVKNTTTCSWEDIEKACIVANSVIPAPVNITIGYDLTTNRNK